MDPATIGVFVGADLAKEAHFVVAMSGENVELFRRPVTNDQAEIETMIGDAAEFGPVALVVDMTASAAQLLLTVAADAGVPVAYVTGLQMRRASELYSGSAKTDARDAWVLADFACRHVDQLTWLKIDDGLLARLSVLNGRNVDLAGDANRTINRCRDAISTISPALERVVGHRLTRPGVRDVLARWSTPALLQTAGKTKIRNTIKKRSPRLATKVTDEIIAALESQSVTVTATDTWGEIITDLIGDLERIQTRRDELGAIIEHEFLDHPLGQVLVTLCGFGPRTGARTLAEIGDPTRFANGSRLAAYAGLAPTDWKSGKTINGSFQHRGGNHRLKNAMFIAAFVASQHDPHARAYYLKKRAEGKRHNAAVICVARRRCDIIWRMLTEQAAYNPNQLPKAA